MKQSDIVFKCQTLGHCLGNVNFGKVIATFLPFSEVQQVCKSGNYTSPAENQNLKYQCYPRILLVLFYNRVIVESHWLLKHKMETK